MIRDSKELRDTLKKLLGPDYLREREIELCTVDDFMDCPLEQEFRVIGGMWPSPIIGSKQEKCGTCGVFVAIAPSSVELMKKHTNSSIICLNCMYKLKPINPFSTTGS